MGFAHAATHRSKKVRLYRQGDINFILNMEPSGQAANFRSMHGPSANAMAFRVHDAAKALKLTIERGATPVEGKAGPMELNIPAIEKTEEHTSELQSLMRRSSAVFCLKKKNTNYN